MGLFDSVEREPIKCPVCGRVLDKFQSKSGFSRLLVVTPEQLLEDMKRLWGSADGAEYYAYCVDHRCGAVYFFYDEKEKKWYQKHITRKELNDYYAGRRDSLY